LREVTISFVMSVCPSAWNNLAPTGLMFMKFDTQVLFESQSRLFKFHRNLTIITGASHKDLRTFMVKSCSIVLRMRNVAGKICRENMKTRFIFNNTSFLKKSCRLWDNVEKSCRDRRQYNTAHALCKLDIPAYTHTLGIHNTYSISTQQRLRQRGSMLHIGTFPVLFILFTNGLLNDAASI
jgi:hypothetical protein